LAIHTLSSIYISALPALHNLLCSPLGSKAVAAFCGEAAPAGKLRAELKDEGAMN
jgi:hypothetical protein